MRRTLVTLLVSALWSGAWPALAQGPETVGEWLSRGREAERALDFEAAEAAYREAAALGPATRLGARAATRLTWLEERRDPRLGYAPLATLERMRRGAADAATLRRDHERARAMPAGRVRREALFVVAEGLFRRLHDPESAIPVYEELRREPGVSAHENAIATLGLAEARSAMGETQRGIAELERAGLGEAFETDELRALERRRVGRIVALGLLAPSLALLFAVGRPWRAGVDGARRALRPMRVAAALYAVAVPAVIAELYAERTADSFGLLALGALPLLAAAALSGESLARRSAKRSARAAVVASVFASLLAVAYLALERAGGLGSFGL